MWPDRRLIDLFGTEFPIVQAPMAGVQDAEIMIGAAQGGALASLPTSICAGETPSRISASRMASARRSDSARE